MGVAYNSSIVTNGLVLCLDAGNRKSYPSPFTGTAWTDLSGQGSIGTLKNGVGYSSTNGGFLTFDGNNDFVSIPNNTALDTQTPTVEVWVKLNSTNTNGFWFEKGVVNTQYALYQTGPFFVWAMRIGGNTSLIGSTTTYMNTTSWHQVVGTYTSGSRRLYVNGTQVASDTQTGTIDTNSGGMSIGAWGASADVDRGYYYNGNLAICRIYNRALTATEIQQNYLATKSRYF